ASSKLTSSKSAPSKFSPVALPRSREASRHLSAIAFDAMRVSHAANGAPRHFHQKPLVSFAFRLPQTILRSTRPHYHNCRRAKRLRLNFSERVPSLIIHT